MNLMKRFFFMLLVLSFLFPLFAEDTRKDAHFYFVQMTDTHFGISETPERTEKIISAVNALPMQIEFIAFTGDIVDTYMSNGKEREDAVSVLKNIRTPVHYLPGNHDINLKNPEKDIALFENSFGRLFSKAEYGGVIFYFIYIESALCSQKIEGFDAWAALEKNLLEDKDRPVIIFTHSPPCPDFNRNKMNYFWKEDALSRFIKLVNSYNVKAVISGHFHRDELHWLEKVPLFAAPPIAGKYGRQGTFRIYEYNNGRIGYWTQYIEK